MMDSADKNQKHLISEALRFLSNEYENYQAFNKFFDGEEYISITSPRQDVGAYQYERSRILFWIDSDAYQDERIAWEDEVNQAKHKEIISLIHDNDLQTPFRDLLAAVKRERVVPFIGAGMSKPMQMPLWSEALSQLLKKLPSADKTTISTMIDSGQYVEAAQALVEHDKVQVTNFIRTIYRVQKMKLKGPMLLLPRFAQGCIVTTNFDDAIEETYRSGKIEFSAYMHGTQEHNFFPRLVRGDRCILKLHGDADNRTTHILTKSQYKDAYGDFDFHKPLPKALRQVFVSQSFLFLGCSLDQDWTLKLFKQAIDADEYAIPNHYAILPAPIETQAKQEKETELLKLNIQPLWYKTGKHEFVEKYLQLIVDVFEQRISFNG
jgi:hypothetical protein